jgi:hypothetical protein
MKINLHIERLILDGVPVDRPRLVQRALKQELTHRLMEGHLSSELHCGGDVPHVNGGTIEVSKGLPATKLGTQIARAVHRGIGGRE